MNILTAQQMRAWDHFTMQHEPVTSIELMERAAHQCAQWILGHMKQRHFIICCGMGNNGGDGLAIARMLFQEGRQVTVYIAQSRDRGTDEFNHNGTRLQHLAVPIHFAGAEEQLPLFDPEAVVVDALLGTGLSGNPAGILAAMIRHINASGCTVVAIDLPSGMLADASSVKNEVVRATVTLTFQCYKLALLVAENAGNFGKVQVLDIGLHAGYLQDLEREYKFTGLPLVKKIFRPRNDFSHKGHFGHAMLLGGSYGKIGAMVLAASACIRSGAGLVTVYVPHCGYSILQTSVPEAMTITDQDEKMIIQPPSELPTAHAVGMGPGMGTEEATQKVVSFIIRRYKKCMVVDADALNCISLQPELIAQLNRNTLLTPHPKEFERLFGACENDFERMQKARNAARKNSIVIILKGHRTLVALPDGSAWFNSTGNSGMAKGGSGDALTGILTALVAQGYPPDEAALLGVYLHGLAGDRAAAQYSREAMTASDLISCLSQVFLELNSNEK